MIKVLEKTIRILRRHLTLKKNVVHIWNDGVNSSLHQDIHVSLSADASESRKVIYRECWGEKRRLFSVTAVIYWSFKALSASQIWEWIAILGGVSGTKPDISWHIPVWWLVDECSLSLNPLIFSSAHTHTRTLTAHHYQPPPSPFLFTLHNSPQVWCVQYQYLHKAAKVTAAC